MSKPGLNSLPLSIMIAKMRHEENTEVKEHDKTMNSLLNNLLETWEINVKAWIEQSSSFYYDSQNETRGK